MAIIATDLLLRLSGGASETDPDNALGGVMSTTTAISPTVGEENLFNNVDAADSAWNDVGNLDYKILIKKASNETRTDTTFASDADFIFPVTANTDYKFKIICYFSAMSGQTKLQWSLPASGTVRYFEVNPGHSIAYTTSTGTTVIGGSPTKHTIIEGVIQIAGTAGTAAFQWALNSGTGTTTMDGTDSSIEIEEF